MFQNLQTSSNDSRAIYINSLAHHTTAFTYLLATLQENFLRILGEMCIFGSCFFVDRKELYFY